MVLNSGVEPLKDVPRVKWGIVDPHDSLDSVSSVSPPEFQ